MVGAQTDNVDCQEQNKTNLWCPQSLENLLNGGRLWQTWRIPSKSIVLKCRHLKPSERGSNRNFCIETGVWCEDQWDQDCHYSVWDQRDAFLQRISRKGLFNGILYSTKPKYSTHIESHARDKLRCSKMSSLKCSASDICSTCTRIWGLCYVLDGSLLKYMIHCNMVSQIKGTSSRGRRVDPVLIKRRHKQGVCCF